MVGRGWRRERGGGWLMNFPTEIQFVTELGFELDSMQDGTAQLRYTPQPAHLNSFLVTHGGASMTLLDVTMAHAARSLDSDMGAVTIEMKTSFMRPAKGTLTARGKVLQRTATMAFTEGSIVDSDGQLCAHATGTFKYVKRLASADKTIHALNPA